MRSLIHILFFFTAMICTGLFTANTVFAMDNWDVPPAITVMSYNIHWGVGKNDAYDLNKIAADITRAHADVVGLQEVDVHWGDRSSFDNQVERLARNLHMHAFFAPVYVLHPDRPGAPSRQHGVAVLSKFPIIRAENHRITRLSTVHPKPAPEKLPGFADVVLQVHGMPVTVYVTHLDYRDDPTIRELQVQETMDVIRQDREPQILLGDLNAPPQAPELAPLLDKLKNVLSACAGLCKSFPADRPIVLIDYILVSPDIQVQRAGVLTTTASDHRPVFAVLTLRRH